MSVELERLFGVLSDTRGRITLASLEHVLSGLVSTVDDNAHDIGVWPAQSGRF